MRMMGKWREETIVLKCGCKVGRSQQGVWFYDFICGEHLPNVQVDGKFNYNKSLKFTEELQKLMKYRKEEADANVAIEGLSSVEMLAYEFIRDAEQPLAIRDMTHQLQGAVGKLKSKGLIEIYKERVKVTKHGFESFKQTKCVRIKECRE